MNYPHTYLEVRLGVQLALVPALDVSGIGLAMRHLVALEVHPGGAAVDVLLEGGAGALKDGTGLGGFASVDVVHHCDEPDGGFQGEWMEEGR